VSTSPPRSSAVGHLDVRTADAGDIAAVAALHVASFRATYVERLSAAQAAALDVRSRAVAWTTRLVEGDGTLLVGTEAGRVQGFVWVGPTTDLDDDPRTTGQVRSIHVAPDALGGGRGRRLLAAGRDALAASGCSDATLWVVADNERAIAVYGRDGWQPDGARREERLGLTGEDAPVAEVVRLRRELADDAHR
jgi:ribosomal protein S18 acetylase RimI-like enzyme